MCFIDSSALCGIVLFARVVACFAMLCCAMVRCVYCGVLYTIHSYATLLSGIP